MEEVSRTATLTADQAIRLARAVKGCSAKQMPYIRKILEAANIELPTEDEVNTAVYGRKDAIKRRRTDKSRDKWQDTSDELSLALRKAYDMDIGFAALSNLTGVGRSALYHYMWGDRCANKEIKEIVINKLNELFTERESKAS